MPPLRARAPLDLDLEDHLIFGLTPVRFGYLAVGALAAYALAGHVPGPLAVPLAVFLLTISAALSWVRWQGRPLDAWALDLAVHARRNLEVDIDPVLLRRIRAPLRRPAHRTIAVSAAEPGAGATTVAVELGAALALKGRRVAIYAGAQGGAHSLPLRVDRGGTHPGSGLQVGRGQARGAAECVILDLGARLRAGRADLSLVVVPGSRRPGAVLPAAQVRALHTEFVPNRVRGGVPENGTYPIPEDDAVPRAQAAEEPVILQFPASPAAGAFRRLADAVDPARPGPWQQESSEVPPAG